MQRVRVCHLSQLSRHCPKILELAGTSRDNSWRLAELPEPAWGEFQAARFCHTLSNSHSLSNFVRAFEEFPKVGLERRGGGASLARLGGLVGAAERGPVTSGGQLRGVSICHRAWASGERPRTKPGGGVARNSVAGVGLTVLVFGRQLVDRIVGTLGGPALAKVYRGSIRRVAHTGAKSQGGSPKIRQGPAWTKIGVAVAI